MLIKTADFDYVEISDENIISFPRGLYGFGDEKRFTLLINPKNDMIFHLQSVSGEKPRFILLDPYMFFSDYKPVLPVETAEIFGHNDTEKLSVFVVAVVPRNIRDMTVNLKSPVLIDFESKIGAQLILENRDYDVRARVFGQSGRETEAG